MSLGRIVRGRQGLEYNRVRRARRLAKINSWKRYSSRRRGLGGRFLSAYNLKNYFK
jgi:hypothetical protein